MAARLVAKACSLESITEFWLVLAIVSAADSSEDSDELLSSSVSSASVVVSVLLRLLLVPLFWEASTLAKVESVFVDDCCVIASRALASDDCVEVEEIVELMMN